MANFGQYFYPILQNACLSFTNRNDTLLAFLSKHDPVPSPCPILHETRNCTELEMIFHYVILPELRCIALRCKGTLSLSNLMDCSEKLWGDPLYDKSYTGIADFSHATIDVQASDIPLLVDFYKRPQTSTGRWAVVVSDPKSTALILIFKASASTQPWFEIFTSWESSCTFLRVNISPSILNEGGDSVFA